MEKSTFEQCKNLVDLKDSKPLIDFLNRLRDGQITEAELSLLGQIIGHSGFNLPDDEIARNFVIRGVYENLRGSQAATESGNLRPKRELMEGVFGLLKSRKIIDDWSNLTKDGRTDYRIMAGTQRVYIEAKGGLDGNSTKISDSPADADEVWKWFMCEGSPKNTPPIQVLKNRLVNDMMRKLKSETGFLVLDYLCGNPDIRPCPKPSQTRLSVLSSVQSPFPDVFLLPQNVQIQNGEYWSSKQIGDYRLVDWFAKLWNLKEKDLVSHVNFIGVKVIDEDARKYLWQIKRFGEKDVWYESAVRTVK